MYSVILGEPAISPSEKTSIATSVKSTFWENNVNAIPMEHTRKPDIIDFNGFMRITMLDTAIWKMMIYKASKFVTNSASNTPGAGL